MQHRTQTDLEQADMTSTGRAFNTPEGYNYGWGPTPGTVRGKAIEGWAPGCLWTDNDTALNYINTGSKTSATWTLTPNLASTNTWTGANTFNAASIFGGAVTFGDSVDHTGGDKTFPIPTTDAAYTVLAVNSGKVHLVPNISADRVYTLPPAVAGLSYEFWSTLITADGHDLQIIADNSADFYEGCLMWTDSDLTVGPVISAPDGSSDHTLNILLPANFLIKLYCDGTNWFINGTVFAADSPTWT